MTTHHGRAKQGSPAARADEALRRVALAYPDAYEDHPWGHCAYKVRGKVFVFVAASEDGLGVSAKLPESNREALLLPFASPTGYGLGKSGWVSASFGPKEVPPVGVLSGWIEESYRAVAPKKLVARLDGEAPVAAGKAKAGRGRSGKKVAKKAKRSKRAGTAGTSEKAMKAKKAKKAKAAGQPAPNAPREKRSARGD